jgi:hypothetical protein
MQACRACGLMNVRTLPEIIAEVPAAPGRAAGQELTTDPAVSMAWGFESKGACSYQCLMQVLMMPPAPETPQGEA